MSAPSQQLQHGRATSISIPSPSSATPSHRSSAMNSSSTLPLVSEDDDNDLSPLLFTQFDSDSSEDDGEEDYYIPHDQRPLSPGVVILLLLGPTIRLGATLLPSVTSMRLVVSIPCLVGAAILGTFTKNLWVLLAHYVRKITVEDLLLEAIGRVWSKRGWKTSVRSVVRFGGVLLRALLVIFYFKVSVDSIGSALPDHSASKPALAAIFSALVIICGPSMSSITSSRVAFLSLLSSFSYITWMALLIRAYTKGNYTRISSLPESLGLTSVWDAISGSLIVFASFPPLSLYAGLSTYRHPSHIIGSHKKQKRTSFGTLSLVAGSIGFALVLPSIILKAIDKNLQSEEEEYSFPAVEISRGLIMLMAIPETLATLPRLPWPTSSSRIRLPRVLQSQIIPRSLVFIGCSLASFLPRPVFSVFSSILIVCTLLSSYLLPAASHILFHHLFRATSIVIPTSHSATNLASPYDDSELESTERLLQAKERSLQKRRLLRRLLWDIGAWAVVIGSVLLLVGKIAHWWWFLM